MKHYILVKYKDDVLEKDKLFQGVSTLFEEAKSMDGIYEINCYQSIIDLPNRYDLMIVMEMEQQSLPIFDQSKVHEIWKKEYSQYLESKAIFDSI